ncbi:sodium channel protein Nach-like [Chironomus tepperi]|uniref:sodium channel protein Nach-like n=1 Tax=Chironomus tepperi TaxID=113505 RepID=UPI00391FC0BD
MAWTGHVQGIEQSMVFAFWDRRSILHRYLVPSLLCNYRFALDPLRDMDVGFKNALTWLIFMETKGYWFRNQAVIWNDKYRPEMIEFLGRNGYGFAFNMMTDKMYQKGVSENFTDVLLKHTFNISEESKHLDPIPYQSYPLYGHGRSNLKMILEKNRYIEYRSICYPLYFSVYLPFEFPGEYEHDTTNKFYYGQDLDVLITPEVIKSDESLRKFPPEKRNCYFEGEKVLKMFKIYTRKNCEMECLTNFYLELNETQCVPYYVIRNQTHKICQIEKNFDIIFRKYQFLQTLSREKKFTKPYLDTCGCLDSCNEVQYTVDVIDTRLPGGITDDDNATMTITFRYKNDKFLPLVRRISFTFDDFLCQAGGLLGLYAGISALSVVELLYFITIRPIFNAYRWIMRKVFKGRGKS